MDLQKNDFEELAEFRYRLRKFLHFSETAARNAGITPNQHQLLLAIQGFPGRDHATPTELAERLQLKHHSCLGLIQRCEHIGLVYRFANEKDKRSVYIQLTPKGREVLNQLTLRHQTELKRLGLSHRNFIFKEISSFES
ncbi:MarR family transcriptional regulator [Alicyclobacillus tolerans]|uniref:MarR family winged helix-turn-helix transcriptional regulator n=1 Tax=Alicyclobacillus tolerans TaxID=90970 RepID=UPI001F0307E5|nr:MarR family transcriptional regulator [Alicyclobacillus tolerans]MCF8566570.1 MarR family transcriptional regulator [Alicyclobacillus tolerans]